MSQTTHTHQRTDYRPLTRVAGTVMGVLMGVFALVHFVDPANGTYPTVLLFAIGATITGTTCTATTALSAWNRAQATSLGYVLMLAPLVALIA